MSSIMLIENRNLDLYFQLIDFYVIFTIFITILY